VIAGHEVADLMGKLEKSEMIEFYKTHITPKSPHRAKLSLHLEPKNKFTPPPPEAPKAEDGGAEPGTVSYIGDWRKWKSSMLREKPTRPLVSLDTLDNATEM